MEFDENLAAVHGYLCSDGYVIRNPEKQKHKYYVIALRNSNDVLLRDFQRKFEACFNDKPAIRNGRCIINSKRIYLELIDRFQSFYSHEWRMPGMEKRLTESWLRAFFDCEGWVEVYGRKSRMVCADSVNIEGLRQIRTALANLGIESRIKPKKHGRIYRIFIFGKGNLKIFNEKIGFLHPKKNAKMCALLSSYPDYNWNLTADAENIRCVMKERGKMKRPFTIRVISNRMDNLRALGDGLSKSCGVRPRINSSFNGQGVRYFELLINRKKDVKKLADSGFLSDQQLARIRYQQYI